MTIKNETNPTLSSVKKTDLQLNVTSVADSCFIFEFNGTRILTDPWIGTTIYGGAWVQFPYPVIKPEDIGPLDYIFISHIHEDHCCIKTIQKLDKNATIILMDRQPNYVENFLNYHKLNFKKILKIKTRDIFWATDYLGFEVVEADPSHALNHLLDSSLLIHYGEKEKKETLYFANDNPPYPAVYDHFKQYNFSLAIVPPAGGSGYPAFYTNLSENEKKEKAKLILRRYQETLKTCLTNIQPNYFFCSASSHVLSGKNHQNNQFMSWANNGNAPYKFLKEHDTEQDTYKPILLSPGQTVNLSDQEIGVSFDKAIEYYENQQERDLFIATVASKEKYEYEYLSLNPSIKFDYLFELAHKRMLKFLTKDNIDLDWSYYIQYDNSFYAHISLKAPYTLSFVSTIDSSSNYLTISPDPRLLFLLLTGGFSWNIADAAGYLIYHRQPDIYINEIYLLINHLRI